MSLRPVSTVLCVGLSVAALCQGPFAKEVKSLKDLGLRSMGAYGLLEELTTKVGNRVDGSANAAKAVDWGKATMERLGFQNVHLVACIVPHWVRGDRETLELLGANGDATPLTCCALGGSVGTAPAGVTGEVIEVRSLAEAAQLGEKAKGKILFFNRPMDPTLTRAFAAYGGAVDQRVGGAAAAAKVGAIAAIVRSMTLDTDDVPHTGVMMYQKGVPQIPTAALSILAANRLSEELKSRGAVSVRLTLNCEKLPDALSANVVGEIVGAEKPNEVIVMGGHLDSWDKGTGAHDDGAGIAQSLEALHLIKELGWKPKRTIRVVLFMDEEQSGSGSTAYAAFVKHSQEKAYAAVESDSGGFAPRAIGSSLSKDQLKKLSKWVQALKAFEVMELTSGSGGGADVGKLGHLGAILFGLEPESQRYFDYHHSANDTLDKVNRRELELGALSIALLSWLLSEEGV